MVEVDGFEFHSSRHRFENDRRRDADLFGLGLRVVRVTWRHITEEPEATLVRVTRALVANTPEMGGMVDTWGGARTSERRPAGGRRGRGVRGQTRRRERDEGARAR